MEDEETAADCLNLHDRVDHGSIGVAGDDQAQRRR
jgi:hypothetical protein